MSIISISTSGDNITVTPSGNNNQIGVSSNNNFNNLVTTILSDTDIAVVSDSGSLYNISLLSGSTGILTVSTEPNIVNTIVTINQGQQGPAGVSIQYVQNYGNNRVLTSDGSPSGLYAESNLSFDGSTLTVGGTPVSLSGHTHLSSAITNFNESVDDRVSGLLVAGTGIYLNYNDPANLLTISTTGISFSGHTHIPSDIIGISGYVNSGIISYFSGLSTISNVCDIEYIVIQDISNNTKLVNISGIAKAIAVIDGGGVLYSGC